MERTQAGLQALDCTLPRGPSWPMIGYSANSWNHGHACPHRLDLPYGHAAAQIDFIRESLLCCILTRAHLPGTKNTSQLCQTGTSMGSDFSSPPPVALTYAWSQSWARLILGRHGQDNWFARRRPNVSPTGHGTFCLVSQWQLARPYQGVIAQSAGLGITVIGGRQD